ncbi:MAG: hypothetical protein M1826_003579 [Phylliscum demangeonii]|nr:MAG: hypothetical protein M1826_003579 [Phylliscum demangeonii]
MPVLLLAVLSLLALLRPVQLMPTESGQGAPTPAEDRADPADYREYLGWEGHGDQSSTFMAKCFAEVRYYDCLPQSALSRNEAMVADVAPIIYVSYLDSLMVACRSLGEHQGLVMQEPYASDWARYTEFKPFLICFFNHMAEGTLPATIVHRPTVPGVVHDAAPATEHGASHPPLQFRHPAARRAGLLHSVARLGRLAPELLREMGPAVQRAETALERRPQLIEH